MRHLFAGGKPKHRQIPREALRDAIEVGRTMGGFAGKMIMMFGADDPLMWPTVAARYHRRVREAGGAAAEERYRLHYLEHGVHGAAPPAMQHRQIPNRAAVCKALDDLMAWVERGIAPVPGTAYTVDERSQIVLPGTAALRRGYQPVVAMSVQRDGADAVLTVTAEDPDNEIARLEVDWAGGGKFAEAKDVRGRSVKEQFRHRYPESGTYFPVVRVTDTTQGPGRTTPGIQNLATASIVIP